MKRLASLSGLALCTALAAGCSTPPVVGHCTPLQEQSDRAALPVSVLSPDLGAMIGVHDVSTYRTAGGLQAIQATLRNCTDLDLAVLVRVRFSGGRGQSEPPSAWRSVILAPRTTASYAENAVSADTRALAIDILDAQRAQQFYRPGQTYLPSAGGDGKR